MFENSFDSRFVKIIGVNTADNGKTSGGIAAVNYMLEKNLPDVNYIAVDRWDVKNLDSCKAIHKFRLLNLEDEKILTANLRGADLIFIAGGNFEDAEDEIIFDTLIKLPSKNFEFDSGKVVQNFIEAMKIKA